jgi:hypothetical protein
MQEKGNRILIVINQGALQEVVSNHPITYTVIDMDEQERNSFEQDTLVEDIEDYIEKVMPDFSKKNGYGLSEE